MFKKIVRYFANRRLIEFYKSSKRTTKIKTLKNSKSIGIIWNPADEGGIESYELLRKTLQAKGIKPNGMAHIGTSREMETLSTITHSGLMDRKSRTWLGRPTSGAGLDFIKEQFDILIDITILKTVAAQYTLVHSEAIFKVGWKGTEPNFYDLNIDVSEKPQCRYLMDSIVYYLENINEKS